MSLALALTGIPGTRSIWADPLYEGPVPGGLTDDELVEVRTRALERFLEDYPSTRDGLSRTERRLLSVADEGLPIARAFPRMHHGEDAYLTAEGGEVFAGRRDRVSYGLDRWMGGVRLKTGETPIWRWNEKKSQVTTSK